jgi:hypothetical protein
MRWNRGAALLATGVALASCSGGGYTPASPASNVAALVSKAGASQWPPPCTAPVQKVPNSYYIVNAEGTVKPGSFAGAETIEAAYWSHAVVSVVPGAQPPPKLGPAIVYWGAYTLTGSGLPAIRGCFVLATSQSGKPLPPPYGSGHNAFTEGVPNVTVPAGSHLEADGASGGRVKDLAITFNPTKGTGKGEGILLTAGGAVMGRIHITLAGKYSYT